MPDETIFQGAKLGVVGNICRDVKTAPLLPDERLFQDGETPTDSIVETIGGGGANSALFAAALGADTRFAGKVGDDALGERLEDALRRRGVTTFIRRDPAVQTGSSLVLTYTNGCRHFICCQTNNYTFDFADIDLSMLDGAGHLLRADVWFSEAMLDGGNARILQAARDRGLATSLDLNWDPFWGSAPRRSDPMAKRRRARRSAAGRSRAWKRPRAEHLRRLDRYRHDAQTARRLGRGRRRSAHGRSRRGLLPRRQVDRGTQRPDPTPIACHGQRRPA